MKEISGDECFDILDKALAHKDKIVELADAITALYKSMDDSLRFKVKAKETTEKSGQVTEKDFRGVGCPMNFVKTKLVLDSLIPKL